LFFYQIILKTSFSPHGLLHVLLLTLLDVAKDGEEIMMQQSQSSSTDRHDQPVEEDVDEKDEEDDATCLELGTPSSPSPSAISGWTAQLWRASGLQDPNFFLKPKQSTCGSQNSSLCDDSSSPLFSAGAQEQVTASNKTTAQSLHLPHSLALTGPVAGFFMVIRLLSC